MENAKKKADMSAREMTGNDGQMFIVKNLVASQMETDGTRNDGQDGRSGLAGHIEKFDCVDAYVMHEFISDFLATCEMTGYQPRTDIYVSLCLGDIWSVEKGNHDEFSDFIDSRIEKFRESYWSGVSDMDPKDETVALMQFENEALAIEFTEFIMCLNWKSWRMDALKDEEMTRFYCRKFENADEAALNVLEGDDLTYYLRTTD